MPPKQRAKCRQTNPDPKFSTLHETGQVQPFVIINGLRSMAEKHSNLCPGKASAMFQIGSFMACHERDDA